MLLGFICPMLCVECYHFDHFCYCLAVLCRIPAPYRCKRAVRQQPVVDEAHFLTSLATSEVAAKPGKRETIYFGTTWSSSGQVTTYNHKSVMMHNMASATQWFWRWSDQTESNNQCQVNDQCLRRVPEDVRFLPFGISTILRRKLTSDDKLATLYNGNVHASHKSSSTIWIWDDRLLHLHK